MSNVSALQQQLNDAEVTVNNLRKQLESERKGERTQAISAVREIIKTNNLTALELGFSGKGAAKRVVSDKRNVVAPKYRDPASGKTWTGRGKSPTWLNSRLAAGSNKQEFLIQN